MECPSPSVLYFRKCRNSFLQICHHVVKKESTRKKFTFEGKVDSCIFFQINKGVTHYCAVVHESQLLRAKRTSSAAVAEDEFERHHCKSFFLKSLWTCLLGMGRGLQKYRLALYPRGVPVFLSLPGPGQVLTRWSGWKRTSFDLAQDPENRDRMTSVQGHIC